MPERSTTDRIAVHAMAARLAARAGATDAASIGRAFRELSALLHPDKGGARADFERLVEARDMLAAGAGASTTSVKPEPRPDPPRRSLLPNE